MIRICPFHDLTILGTHRALRLTLGAPVDFALEVSPGLTVEAALGDKAAAFGVSVLDTTAEPADVTAPAARRRHSVTPASRHDEEGC